MTYERLDFDRLSMLSLYFFEHAFAIVAYFWELCCLQTLKLIINLIDLF